MSEYYDEIPLAYSNDNNLPSDDQFVGNGWSIRKSEGKFYFSYISGELAGRLKEIEIPESDFEQAKLGKMSFDNLCVKHGVW